MEFQTKSLLIFTLLAGKGASCSFLLGKGCILTPLLDFSSYKRWDKKFKLAARPSLRGSKSLTFINNSLAHRKM
jgi:hypothetical protein